MSSEKAQGLELRLEAIATSFRDVLEWKWDGRFKTALAEFAADKKDDVLGILGQFLTTVWNASSINDAPDAVVQVKKSLGGLMPGQLLLVSDDALTAFIYCAWWPWGNGQKISIRVAPFGEDMSAEDKATLVAAVHRIFEI